MDMNGYLLSSLILILIHSGQDHLVEAVTTREITFVRNINPALDSNSQPTSDLSSSNLSQFACAVQCLNEFPACTSYLHNASTGVCVRAVKPDPLVSQLESGLGDLYVTCDTIGGFTMHRYRTAAACIAIVSSPKVNYTLASTYCEQMGGYLASVKTLDKLHLLITALAGSNNFWVGMDDMGVEGTYVWKEDGTVGLQINATYTARQMAEITMYGMWDHPREPNNYLNNEHCIQLKYSNTHLEHRLNDFKCFTRSKFISLAGSNNFWVGMDDMGVEGTYVWKEDGTVGLQINATYTARQMAEITMYGMWDHPREPNNYLNNEHCIQLKYSSTHLEHRLNDFKCFTRSKFICEERIQFV